MFSKQLTLQHLILNGLYYQNVSKFPSFRVYCLLGDGEVAEGAVWEAMAFASHYK